MIAEPQKFCRKNAEIRGNVRKYAPQQCDLVKRRGWGYYARTGLGLCNAQLCTMHFDEDTRGLQPRGILGLLTFCHLAAGGTPGASFSDDGRISSSCKASPAVETCAGAFWWTKLSTINTTMNCIGQESSRTLCTIMQISQVVHCAQLCTIMHVHKFPSPVQDNSRGWLDPGVAILARHMQYIALWGFDGREENCFAGGGMARNPICPTPPLPLLGRRAGRGVWAGAALPALPGGGGPTPTYMAQNDPRVALIILTTHMWGKIFS